MKKLILGIAFIGILLCGCQKDKVEPDPVNPEPEYYMINLGSNLTCEDVPLTSNKVASAAGVTESNDLYGIQVSKILSDGSYDNYAYGLFDNINDMIIKMLSSNKYSIMITLIKDGKNLIRKETDNSFKEPFDLGCNDNLKVENKFIYDVSKNLGSFTEYGGFKDGINHGTSFLNDGKIYKRPNISGRYFGILRNYHPSEEGSININMIKTVFGVKYVPDDGFTEGKIKINLAGTPELIINHGEEYKEEIYSLLYLNEAWDNKNNQGYSEEIGISIIWEKVDGTTVPLTNQNLFFKRNMKKIINIEVKEQSSDNTLNVSEEDTEMQTGEEITVGGDSSEHDIDPNEE